MTYHLELLHTLLNDFLTGNSALLTLEGEVLAIRGPAAFQSGTLPAAASNTVKYLKLQEGDIVLLNDPYSGGSVLSHFTFVVALSEDLLLVKSMSYSNCWSLTTSIEQEGLRIPPTPIRQNGKLNDMILQAMQGHPSCPPNFPEWISEQCESLLKECQRFVRATEIIDLELDMDLIQQYLKLSRQMAQHKISETTGGETRVDIKLDNGELIRMNVEVVDGKVALDFSGTTASKTVNLTEAATFGTCFQWVANYYGFADFMNSGTFAVFQMTKPFGCLLNSKYPAPVYKGMTDGVAALQLGLQTAFSHIQPKREASPDATSALRLHLKTTSSSLGLTLHGGCGANLETDGAPAAGLGEQISIERTERSFPVLFEKIDYREKSPTNFKYNGGAGLTLQLRALDEVQISWISDLNSHTPKLSKNCFEGEKSRVLFVNSQGERVLPTQGQLLIKKGELSIFSSASGGGYGKN